MVSNFLITLCFIGCMIKAEKNTVNIFLNPQNYGWYFIEIKQDSLIKDKATVNIKIDSTTQLQEIIVSKYDKFDFKVFDGGGTDISSKMKLSGILFNDDKRIFFKFYNPSEQELEKIKNWLPTDPNYQDIISKSKQQLKKMLDK